MTTPKLLSNLPVEKLNEETDYLGLRDKGNLIKQILINNKDQFNEIKMFSLHGEWGSGKSSLMKYLESELQEDFNTFFFEAWEYEKDENLAYSLVEFLASKNQDTLGDTFDEVLKFGGRILRGLGKSIKMNIPLFPNGPGIELAPSAFVEEMADKEELTFYEALNSFKTEFIRLEDKITANKEQKYNIVFIDDLDRCEPEQVLNLLSAIKLFFTYGNKTIFFCGVDKKAITEAVKTKYGEVIKANEYLEKIFDISFNMPHHENLKLLLNNYFNERSYGSFGYEKSIVDWVEEFLKELKFTNPRHVKKTLNKFLILRNVKALEVYDDFPNIDMGDKAGNLFETLLVIYLIILHEFFNDTFDYFLDYEKKKMSFIKLSEKEKQIEGKVNWSLPTFLQILLSPKLPNLKFKYFYGENARNVLSGSNELAIILCPSEFDNFLIGGISLFDYEFIVQGDNPELSFYNYIKQRLTVFFGEDSFSDSTFKSVKEIIKRAL